MANVNRAIRGGLINGLSLADAIEDRQRKRKYESLSDIARGGFEQPEAMNEFGAGLIELGHIAEGSRMVAPQQMSPLEALRAEKLQQEIDRNGRPWWVNEQNQVNPAYLQGRRAGATRVNVNNSSGSRFPIPEYSKLEPGFVYIRNPDGTVKLNDRGIPEVAPVVGGKADTAAKVLEDKANLRADARQKVADVVLDEIDIAQTLISGANTPTTGLIGGVLSNIDSTSAGALKNRLETIKSNIGMDKLQSMREASPTGGALGQVSNFENRLLQAVFGSLEQSQTAADLQYNLNRVAQIYSRIVNEGIPDEEAQAMYRQEALRGHVGEQAVPDVPEGVDPEDWQFMTPEERALWQ